MGVEEGLDCTHACRLLIAGEQAWTNQAEVELAESERILALSSLAFLPLPTVERAFDLVKMMFPVEERPITKYFEWTYIAIGPRVPIRVRFTMRHCSPKFRSVHDRHLILSPDDNECCGEFPSSPTIGFASCIAPVCTTIRSRSIQTGGKGGRSLWCIAGGQSKDPFQNITSENFALVTRVRAATIAPRKVFSGDNRKLAHTARHRLSFQNLRTKIARIFFRAAATLNCPSRRAGATERVCRCLTQPQSLSGDTV